MPPNLRPTLSNRIRASFDGKRSKSNAQKPQETNKFVVQDAATLRDAIGQAISNDTFQNAIAVHLARLIEPSIKDALDTIQPVVETVYQHDVLLRKTNRSVEDLLQRFDSAAEKEEHEPTNKLSKDVTGAEEIRQLLNEHSAQNNTRFEELSSSVREGHGTMGQIVTDIAEIRAAMSFSSKSLKSLESTALQSTTDNFKLQEQLDEVKMDISNFRKSIDSQSSTLVRINEAELATAQILGDVQQSHASHTLALNEIKAHDQSFKSASIPIFEKTHADTAAAFQTLTARLAAVNENVTASSASENDKILGLGAKFDKVLTSFDTISTKDSSHEILTAVRKSNDFHTIHVAALEGIMDKLATPDAEKDISSESGGLTSLKEQVRDIATTLDSHTNHLAAIRESDRSADILVAVHASNEYHASSGADLSEIKAATKATDQSHISHSADLAEIKAVVEAAGKSHASHTKAFGDLQAAVTTANESHNSHTAALEAIRAANDNSAQGMTSQVKSLEALGSQMGTVIATLGSQSIVHSDIRDTVHASQDAHASHSVNLGEVKEIVKAAVESHTAHARALENIKSGQQGTIEQLATHARTLDGVQAQVGIVVNNLGEQTAVHSEILNAVHTSSASHASHTTAFEDVIAAHKNTSTQLTKHTTTLDTVSAQLGTINTTLQHQNTTHSQLLDAVQASNASHESHAIALDKAETMHTDILSGVNGSRGLLVGHNEILASHASLLESARDAHSKDNDNIMDAVKQSRGLLESQSGAIREMESSHEQIRNSVQALGGGLHLNENGLGQLRDHLKVSVAQRSEPASETAEAVREPHSLDDGKTALGLGMAAVTGGGLLAVAGSDGFYHHEGEKAGKAPLDKTSVEETAVGAKDVDKARLSESVNELTEPVEAVTLGEPLAEVHNPVQDVTAEPEEKDQIQGSIPIVPEEVDQVEETLPIQRVETDQVENTTPDNTEEVHQSEETIPNKTEEEHQIEKNTTLEPTVGVADSTKGITDPAEETKPVEQVQEEVEPVQQKDSAVDDPVHEIESAGKDEHVFEDSARKLGNKLAVENQSVNELPIQEPSHEILGDEIAAEKDPLHRESAQLNEFAPTPAPEPEAELIQEKELVREDGPSLYETAANGSPLTESYVEQPVQEFDRRLEEPIDAVLPGDTIETPTTSEVVHEESGEESKAEHNEALNELPLGEKPSLEEQIPRERRLSYEAEPEHDAKLAGDGALVMENIADVPIHESEIPVEPGSIPGEQPVRKLLSAHEPEPKNVIESNRDGSAPVSKSAIIPENIEESVLDSKNEQGAEEPLSEVLTVKHGEYVERTPIKQSIIDVTPAIADKSSTDDPSSEIWQDKESQSLLGKYPAMDGLILQESSMLPAVVEEPHIGEEVETMKSQPVVTAQDVEEKDVRFKTFPINESAFERRSVAQELPAVEAATEIPENVTLPMGIAEETREVPSDLVEPVAREAGQIGDGSPVTVESVYEAQTSLEAKPVLGVPSVAAESIDGAKPEMDGEQNASDMEVAHGEPGLEKVGTGDKTEDGLVLEPLDGDGSAVTSQGIASKLADEVPLVEPVAVESAMRTRNTGPERRPTLTKRVSFKEPPTEEKLNPDKHVESGPLSTEETIVEEQHSDTLLPIGDDPANEEPSGGVQEKSSTTEDKPTLEDSHINMPGMEVEPYKEEASLEKMPTLASEKSAEDDSNGSDLSNRGILQPTIEEPYPSPKQTPETEQAKESKPIDDEPVLGESNQKVSALHSSATDDVEVSHEEAKPMGDEELKHVTDSNTGSVIQHEARTKSEKLEQFPVEEKIGESEPATDDTSPMHETIKDSEVEPKGEAKLYPDHSTLEDFSPGDHAMEDADEKGLNPNNSAPQKLVMETQSEETAAETITVKPKLVPEEVPLAPHGSATEDSDDKSREEPITDGLIASEVPTQEHAGDQQIVHDTKHGSVANGHIAEEPAIDLPPTITKDESGPAADKRSVDKPSPEDYVNEPAPTTPILQASPVNDAVVDEPPILGAQNENPTIIKPKGMTDSESENRTGEPLTASDATLAEPVIEKPVLYNQGEEDLAENSMAVSAADNKLAVNGSVNEENAVESKAVEEPVVQNSLPVESDEETKAQLEEPARETAVEELSGTEPLHSTKADTSTNINPAKVESDQPGEVGIKDQDEPTTKESILEESVLSDREVVVEGSHKENMSSEDEKLYEKPEAENSGIGIESPAEGSSLKAEPVTTGVVEDAKSAAVFDSTMETSDIPIETLGETETHMEDSTIASEHGKAAICDVESETTLENEPSTTTAQAPEKGHAEDEIVPNQLPIRDQIDLPVHAHQPASEESIWHESPSSEPTDGMNADKSGSTPPLIVHPTRVDSGIEIETPTEAKSASKIELLDKIVTGPLPNNTSQIDPSPEIATKDLNVASTSTEEEVSGIESHEDELFAKSAIFKPNPESEPIPDQPGDESQEATDKPLEEDQFFDVVDEPGDKMLSTATVEPSVKTTSAGDRMNGNFVHEIISAEPTIGISSEKELLLDMNDSTKQQHARMDSGIDVETPTTEPFPKLESVVEVKPASDVDPGLEDGM